MVRMREALMENRWRAVESMDHIVVVVMASRYVQAANMVRMLEALMENRWRAVVFITAMQKVRMEERFVLVVGTRNRCITRRSFGRKLRCASFAPHSLFVSGKN